MKEKRLKYSVLRYSPSTGERINLGILLCEEELHYMEFRYLRSYKRLTQFDDEIDLELVKLLLSSIKEEAEGNVLDNKRNSLEDIIKFYDNDFLFDEPKSIIYDDLQGIVDRLIKIYFRFDLPKSKRSSAKDDLEFLEGLLSSSSNKVKKNEKMFGTCNEVIRYDYVTDNYKIKWIDFDGKDLIKLIPSVKAWAWNCLNDDNKNTVIIYRTNREVQKTKEFSIIMNIFRKSDVKAYELASASELFA